VDGDGNVFIADTGNHRVRKVAPDGTLTTLAGNGAQGFAGDGGPATEGSLALPSGVAVDGDGNIFIVDGENNRIRKIALDGTLSTVAGNGSEAFAADGGLAAASPLNEPSGVAVDGVGNVFIAEASSNRVRRVADGILSTAAGNGDPAGFFGVGPATLSELARPSGVAVDGVGNVFIADRVNSRVRKWVALDGSLSLVAGTGIPGDSVAGGLATLSELNEPLGVAVDGVGNVFIADTFNHRIRRLAPDGTLSTLAGQGHDSRGFAGDGGPATEGKLNFPEGVAADGVGNVFIADTVNHRVRKVAPDRTLTTLAGNGAQGFAGDGGPATAGELAAPSGVAVDGVGNVFIADTLNHRVRQVAPDGTLTTLAGNGVADFAGDGGPATGGALNFPAGLAVDGDGNVFIADTGNHRVRKVALDGTLTTVAGNAAFDTNGNAIADFSGDGGPATDGALAFPSGVAVDGVGNLFIADQNNDRVRRVAPDGTLSTVAGGAEPGGAFTFALLPSPAALALMDDGLAIAAGARAFAIDLSAASVAVVAGYPGGFAGTAQASLSRLLADSAGIAFDAEAPCLYLTERAEHTLRRVDILDPANVLTWTISTVGGLEGEDGFVDGVLADARFDSPAGLAFDDPTRTLYVADSGNHVVRAIDVDADLVTTFAGTPRTLGFFGDDDPASDALLFGPQAVALDANGNVFIADTRNERVRKVDASGVITTVIGDGTAGSSGVGAPARLFPVEEPLGLAVDGFGNLYVTSTVALRQVTAGVDGVASGDDEVRTIYGLAPRDTFPEDTTRCLTGVMVSADDTLHLVDRCAGLLVALVRTP
jgi:sugar lactone lactonase YvrE